MTWGEDSKGFVTAEYWPVTTQRPKNGPILVASSERTLVFEKQKKLGFSCGKWESMNENANG